MIPESVFSPQSQHWKVSLSTSFRQVRALLKYCELENAFPEISNDAGFPFRLTHYYASLIEKGNAQDPLLLQVIPRAQELEEQTGYALDAVGDLPAMPIPGLIHKYHGRVLLTLTAACAIHCRYCFRRHFPYHEANIDTSSDSEIIKYLTQHTEISEVILSGGDPLMLSDHKLLQIIENLNRIPHIRILRIHSRLLSVLPERVDDEFIEVFSQFDGQVVFVTHINHAQEISELNQRAFAQLKDQGYTLLNQSVLLKGVNNEVDTLRDLSFKLFSSQILPYYLHRLDKVQGAAHFDISRKDSCALYKNLQKALPGYLLPRLVEEIPEQYSKTLSHCE